MIIRKVFDFENAHIVRNCSSKRCRESIHGHSYKCEVLLESEYLDNAGMVYDFGLMKLEIADIIDSFDHSTTIWAKDDEEYKNTLKKFSTRWIEIPFNPSAEQFSRVIFVLIDKVLSLTNMQNGEKGVVLYSIIIHETDSGYAQCFRDDAYNENMGEFDIKDIKFSEQIIKEWKNPKMLDQIYSNLQFTNPKEC